MMSKEDMINVLEVSLEEKIRKINRLEAEIASIQKERDWAFAKLRDTQCRIRKLNWMLQQEDEAF